MCSSPQFTGRNSVISAVHGCVSVECLVLCVLGLLRSAVRARWYLGLSYLSALSVCVVSDLLSVSCERRGVEAD